MMPLPIAPGVATPTSGGDSDVTSMSGDFAALLALVAPALLPIPPTDSEAPAAAGHLPAPLEIPTLPALPPPPPPTAPTEEPPATPAAVPPPTDGAPTAPPAAPRPEPTLVAVRPAPRVPDQAIPVSVPVEPSAGPDAVQVAPETIADLPPTPNTPTAADIAQLPPHAAPTVRRALPTDDRSPAAPVPILQPPIRAEAPAPVDLPATTAPVNPPAVPDQIVSAVVPLHGRGDGRHEITLELRPEELGTIRVEVAVEDRTVHLRLHAADPVTSRLLSAALPELRSALTDAGLTAGHLGVGPDAGGGPGQRRPSATTPVRRPDRPGLAGQPEAKPPVRSRPPASPGRLDLLL